MLRGFVDMVMSTGTPGNRERLVLGYKGLSFPHQAAFLFSLPEKHIVQNVNQNDKIKLNNIRVLTGVIVLSVYR